MGLRYITILGKPFVPTDIAGLQLWVDASDASTINAGSPVDNDAVGNWNDKSGNGYDFIQNTGGLKPVYKTNIQNGKAVIRGSASLMLAAMGADLTSYSVFLVLNVTTLRQYDCILGTNNQTTGASIIEIGPAASSFDVWDINVGSKMPTGAGSVASGTWYRANVTYTQATPAGVFYINNVSFGTTNQASMFLESSSVAIFDDGAAGFTAFRGDIAEIIIYNSVLSTGNRNNVDLYLKAKWGL